MVVIFWETIHFPEVTSLLYNILHIIYKISLCLSNIYIKI